MATLSRDTQTERERSRSLGLVVELVLVLVLVGSPDGIVLRPLASQTHELRRIGVGRAQVDGRQVMIVMAVVVAVVMIEAVVVVTVVAEEDGLVVPLVLARAGRQKADARVDGREPGAAVHQRVEVEGYAGGGCGDGDAGDLVGRLHVARRRLDDALDREARRPGELGLGEDAGQAVGLMRPEARVLGLGGCCCC